MTQTNNMTECIYDFQKLHDEVSKMIYKKMQEKNAKLTFVLYVDLEDATATTDETMCPLMIDGESLFGDVFKSFEPFRIKAFEKVFKKAIKAGLPAFELTLKVSSKRFPSGMTLLYTPERETPIISFRSIV